MQIQFIRSHQRIYLMDDTGAVVKDWECHSDFFDGVNEEGLPRESLPVGNYWCWAEVTNGKYGASYGNFYITTGDPRGRDIHGGGAGLENPFADYQGWLPTYGCLRMQNVDGVELSEMIIAEGNSILLEVID